MIWFCSAAGAWETKAEKLRAFPKRASHTTGWMSEMKSWIGFLYHFLRSLFVRAQRPCRGLLFSFGAAFHVGVGTGRLSTLGTSTRFSSVVVVAALISSGVICFYHLLALIIVTRCENICILSVSSSLRLLPVNSRYASSSVGLVRAILFTCSPFERITSIICGEASSPNSALIL